MPIINTDVSHKNALKTTFVQWHPLGIFKDHVKETNPATKNHLFFFLIAQAHLK